MNFVALYDLCKGDPAFLDGDYTLGELSRDARGWAVADRHVRLDRDMVGHTVWEPEALADEIRAAGGRIPEIHGPRRPLLASRTGRRKDSDLDVGHGCQMPGRFCPLCSPGAPALSP